MKGYTLLLLAIVAGTNAQYFYPQPQPAFNFPTTLPPTTRPPPTQPVIVQTVPTTTSAPVTVPNFEYLPPLQQEAVFAEVQETPAPTTRPPTPPPTTRPPPPPPTTRPPPPPPTTRPPPPPTTTRPPPPPTTRPPATQAPTTPPPYYIPPVQEQDQAQIVFVTIPPTTPPTTRPPPPPTTTRPPPPPPTTQAPTTRPPVVATVQGGYNYPKPEPEFPLIPDSANDNQVLVLVPTTSKPTPPPVAPVEAADEEHHHHDHDHHLFWDFRESIPGEPGQDYPILDTIPATAFSCKGRPTGYYADVEARCQVFHICIENPNGAAIQNSFLCPNGTIFNQESFSCQWWPDVNCQSSDQFYSLNENIGKVPEKPATTARPPAPPTAPVVAGSQATLAQASDNQQVILIPVSKPVSETAVPSVDNPVYEKPTQLYGAPPVQASRVDTVGLRPPFTYRK